MPMPPAAATVAAVLLLATATATAHEEGHSAAEKAILYRHSVYHVIEWNVVAMAAMLKGETPYDAAAFSMRAGRVQALVPMLLEGFPAGSYVAGKTLAKPSIWSERADFEELLRRLGTRSTALASAAAGGQLAVIRPAFDELTATCKECHKRFKEKGGH